MLRLALVPILVALSSVPSLLAQEGPPPRRSEWKPTLDLPADLWHDVTAATIGATAEWTNKVELADVDGDGRVDVILANGGDYQAPGTAVPTRVFKNVADGRWPEITQQVFGDFVGFVRVVKVRDVDGDGHVDIFVGATFQTQSRLYRGLGNGRFEDATQRWLPQMPLSVGDAEFGDVDFDGDLDLVLADWGPGSPMKNDGARPRLWRNDGDRFVDCVDDEIPAIAVRFCWELELVDVDNDLDLDLLLSSKRSPGSFLLENDGRGTFADVSAARLPQFTNNYEFEAMDVDGDGWLDLVTINDGVGARRFTEHLLCNDGQGGFYDATAQRWPVVDNPAADDNMIAFLDYDSDGDADFLIASLDGVDRLLVNDGRGNFRAGGPVFDGEPTRATLGIALADLDGDHRLDCVHAEGEVKDAEADRVFFGKALAKDTAAPCIGQLDARAVGGSVLLRVRVHDRKSPCMPHDWQRVELVVGQQDDRSAQRVPMKWYGEYLWWTALSLKAGDELTLSVEAVDAAGNVARSPQGSVRGR
ncbi:MAG: VCBS repeat-containing protein [Planctomycetes bacterium]|nr:VCBS repeat-containing protein [Planctomycetota bacterium]